MRGVAVLFLKGLPGPPKMGTTCETSRRSLGAMSHWGLAMPVETPGFQEAAGAAVAHTHWAVITHIPGRSLHLYLGSHYTNTWAVITLIPGQSLHLYLGSHYTYTWAVITLIPGRSLHSSHTRAVIPHLYLGGHLSQAVLEGLHQAWGPLTLMLGTLLDTASRG